ncbi:hypothetical protein L1987_44301 [Smallanthus sonchifolius]|uniref:Uncharacterized protein n=1 Tax=Smallanthus sonchifolius TaxID=185202 RepID=A0ACB9GPU5_9ASTR|nr:hypothetical protein L1987_44301 [Smallanthus sonchifolius]
MYPHAKGILNALKDKGVDMAIASISPSRYIAETYIDKLGIKSMFVAQIVAVEPILFSFCFRCCLIRDFSSISD